MGRRGPMSREEIERLDDQGMAAWDGHDAEGFANLFADKFAVNDVAMPEPVTTKDGVRQYAQGWFTAFPDMSVKQTNRVVSDEVVAAEVQFTGTNTGPMMMAGKETPPTGKSVVGQGTSPAPLTGGKAVQFTPSPPTAGLVLQLGFMRQVQAPEPYRSLTR